RIPAVGPSRDLNCRNASPHCRLEPSPERLAISPLDASIDKVRIYVRARVLERNNKAAPRGLRRVLSAEIDIANLDACPALSIRLNVNPGVWKAGAQLINGHTDLGSYRRHAH